MNGLIPERHHILHIVPSLGCGGMEKVLVDLICASSAQVRHTIISLSDDVTMAGALPEGVVVSITPKKEGQDLKIHLTLFQLLRKHRPDVVNTYNFGTMEYQWLAALCGCRRRVHVDHGLGGDPSHGNSQWRRKFRKMISGLLDAYIVVSEDLRDWVTHVVGVPSNKVHLIRNGVLIPTERHQAPQRKDVGLSLITVGRMVEVKNQQALIRAAARWNREHPTLPPVHIHLVGDGVLRPELEEIARQSGSVKTTHFWGQTLTPWAHANRADAFILTSLYEAMPMTILEAMSRSCPVLCAKVGGIGDFISPNEAVLFEGGSDAALYQSIDQFYHLPREDRAALAERGKVFVSTHYSQQRMAEQYLKAWGILAC